MLPVLLVVLLAADETAAPPEATAPLGDTRAKDTAFVGLVTALVAGGLAAAIPALEPRPGGTAASLYLGTTAFVLVAFVRPPVFFGGQPIRAKPTALNNVLRVLGSLTAVFGLGALISGFVLRPSRPEGSAWMMAGAAGLEAMSAAAFSIDAFLGLP